MIQIVAALLLSSAPVQAGPANARPDAYAACVRMCDFNYRGQQAGQCRAQCFERYIRGQANAGNRPYSFRCETYEPECEQPFARDRDEERSSRYEEEN